MGRNKLEKPKDKIIQARISSSEMDFYRNYAQSNGMTISVLIRMALIQYCKDK